MYDVDKVMVRVLAYCRRLAKSPEDFLRAFSMALPMTSPRTSPSSVFFPFQPRVPIFPTSARLFSTWVESKFLVDDEAVNFAVGCLQAYGEEICLQIPRAEILDRHVPDLDDLYHDLRLVRFSLQELNRFS